MADFGNLFYYLNDYTKANNVLRKGLKLARKLRHPERISQILVLLAKIAIKQGDRIKAQEYIDEGLQIAHKVKRFDRMCVLQSLQSQIDASQDPHQDVKD